MLTRREFAAFALAAADAAPRTVIAGALDGDYNGLVATLQANSLLNTNLKWTGGRATLVQLGNIVDSGPGPRAALDLLMRLEKEARQAGGRIHVLPGESEARRLAGDLTRTHPAEFASFKTGNSDRARDALYQKHVEANSELDHSTRTDLRLGYRHRWEQSHPLGEAELRQAFSPKGRYGGWILKRDAVLQLGDTLFVHGGIAADMARWPIARINDVVRNNLRLGVPPDPRSPLAWRGLVVDHEDTLAPLVDALLAAHSARRIVATAWAAGASARLRLDSRVLLCGPARQSVVAFEDGSAWLVESGRRIELARL